MVGRTEPGGLDTTFSSINDISARIKTYGSYSINTQTIFFPNKISHLDYFI